MDFSPALSVASITSDMTDEELDQYFASYVPLSNLPTPPPAKEAPSQPCDIPPVNPPTAVVDQAPELHVYATHLAHLVPLNASSQRPSVSVVTGFLERADLPTETVAFAACILDALSQRFAGSWRDACVPRLSPFSFCRQQPAMGPELVVLSALVLAHGYLDDRGRSNSRWARIIGASLFSAQDIERTKMCMLQDMDYGLFRISEDMVQHMMRDMQRACSFTSSSSSSPSSLVATARTDGIAGKEERRPKLSLDLHGAAVWKFGMQTPEPSP
ncbi:hypothetical protein BS50DRAFT_584919 [Corynespora cassiicola Philippines]|uniref:Cyclin N-terminal domain-containing protein n=1 Tax=Corynespora cassiicola Philippines TaxID=1448308 RepID=A0A2T2P242_CORCC|nr:hypothetical protein BS50DRAFT_584919 [Corynespora cassiicola Philippines]